MPVDLPADAERLLLELTRVEADIARHRARLDRRQIEIAAPFAREIRRSPAGERASMAKAAGERIVKLRRSVFRSELAHLAATIVNAERRRWQILRQLDPFDLGEGLGHMTSRGFNLRGTFSLAAAYREGDVVALNGGSFAAKRDDPGPCPGPGWQLLVARGKAGRPGADCKQTWRPTT